MMLKIINTLFLIIGLILGGFIALASAQGCFKWQDPNVSFDGGVLSSPVDEVIIYIGDTPASAVEMDRLKSPFTYDAENFVYYPSDCNSIGLTPHKWVCLRFANANGVSEQECTERNPPGKSKPRIN